MIQTELSTKTKFVTRWFIGTFIGWILGGLTLFLVPVIWEIFTNVAYQYFREAAWYEALGGWLGDIIFYILSFGALLLMGLVIGLAQWQKALKGKVNKRLWVLSSAFSIAMSVISLLIGIHITPSLFSFDSGTYSGLDAALSVKDTWPITVLILGIGFGVAMGIPKWLFLRSHFPKIQHLVLADIITGIATFAWIVFVVSVLTNAIISSTLICCTIPIVLAVVTGVTLFNQLEHVTQTRN